MNVGITCGVIYGFRLMNNLTQVNMWEVKMFREADSGLNEPREISNDLALGQPWSSELGGGN